MTNIEQRIREAFDDFDQLLIEGLCVDEGIAQAANGNRIKPDVFRARAERHLGDLEVHRTKLTLRVAWQEREKEKREALAKLEQEVREAAVKAAEGTYYACCLDNPALAGRPSWPYCIENLIERLEINDAGLREAARESFCATVERLDQKHGTHTAHFR